MSSPVCVLVFWGLSFSNFFTCFFVTASIPKEEQRLLPLESRPPRLYGLPKVYKHGNPLRRIVSTCGSPTYGLAKYVAKQPAQYSGNTKIFVKNSEHFTEILQQHEITKEDLLVSFEVESLFSNVPVEETLEIIKEQLIPKGLQPDLIHLARLCLTSTYFLWNGEFYEQASGVAMGSPLSSVIANIFMEAFEHEAIESSRMKPKCWYRYVDDTFVIWPHAPRTLEEFLQHINRQHANVNFTMEIEEDGNLPFLDVLVERTDSLCRLRGGLIVFQNRTFVNGFLQQKEYKYITGSFMMTVN
ncbi:hypothetical protein Trydic_g16342 [Trypoxylus dichotomus]